MFKPAAGDLLGVFMNENTLAYEWCGPVRIVISFSRRGDALNGHYAADKKGLRYIKPMIEDFCSWAFEQYKWCTMILATIEKPSAVRIIEKCGFSHVIDYDKYKIYMRAR